MGLTNRTLFRDSTTVMLTETVKNYVYPLNTTVMRKIENYRRNRQHRKCSANCGRSVKNT